MRRRQFIMAGPALLAAPALAQPAWPEQPVRLVVPFAPGGPSDITARLFADELTKMLPQRVVVENRSGAGVVVGTELVAKAPKDGLTLLYTTVAHAVLRPLFPQLSFDAIADFQPVALLGLVPMVLLVNKELPVQDLAGFVRLLREHPGRYNYGSGGNGSAVHLASELFLARAGGLQAQHIPYRGGAPAYADLLSGRLAMYMDVASSGLKPALDGQARGLGISAAARVPQAPGLPTFAEGGVTGAECATWHMVLAPAGTPAEKVQAANAALMRVTALPEVQRRLGDQAMQLRTDSTPASSATFLSAEEAKWAGVIRQAGIRVD